MTRSLRISADLALPMSTVTSTLVVYGGKGMGKRLALDTPLPTPGGWTTMGEVRVGDELLGADGCPCRVTYVSPIALGESYEVEFSDGSTIKADADHLWRTETCHERRRGGASVRTTREILQSLTHRQGQQLARNHAIHNAAPLNLPDADLPIDPYTLGVWLGDGSSAAATIHSGDEDLASYRAEMLSAGVVTRSHRRQALKAPHFGVLDLKVPLRDLGVLENKHVPPIYLRASARQRLALLQGLMDTDGTVAMHAGPSAQFDNTNEELADAVYELVVSLGMKATRRAKRATLRGVDHGVCHRVTFVPTLRVFRLYRKASLLEFGKAQRERRVRRYVRAVQQIPAVEMRCISVDAPDQLYLAGHAMVPTHNTNLGAVIVEEMAKAGLRWRLLDPLGVSYGLRHSKDGKGKGVECLILGGVHGDMPIEPTGGAVVADFIVDEDVNVIVDFSRRASGEMWSINEKIRFLTDVAQRAFQRQGSLIDGRRRDPFFLMLDEAARYIPQIIPAGRQELAFCVGAWEQLVEEGRNVGIGVGLLTQRSARMNKSVSELADAIFAFRTIGPNSLDAILDWLGDHVAKARIKELIEEIRQLDVGHCLVVSPGWLKHEGIVHIRERETFDSSATPRPGERQKKVSGAAAVPDLAKYLDRMKDTIDKAKAADPRELQKEIARLKGEIVKAGKLVAHSMHAPAKGAAPDPAALQAKIDRAVTAAVTEERKRARHANQTLRRQLADVLQGLGTRIPTALVNLDNAIGALKASLTSAIDGIEERLIGPAPTAEVVSRSPFVSKTEMVSKGTVASSRSPRPNTDARSIAATNGGGAIGGKGQLILDAIAFYETVDQPEPPRSWVAGFAGMSTGGTLSARLSELRIAGYIVDVVGGRVALTDAGREVADASRLPTSRDALHEMWLAKLGGKAAEILRKLIDVYPDSISRADLAERVGMTTGGTFSARLSEIRGPGLLEDARGGDVRVSEVLFPPGLN